MTDMDVNTKIDNMQKKAAPCRNRFGLLTGYSILFMSFKEFPIVVALVQRHIAQILCVGS